MTCSIECFNAYADQVAVARAAKKTVNLAPERTDMTEAEMQNLMSKPLDEVIEITKDELKDYSRELAANGFGGTVDIINEEIRNAENTGDTVNETQLDSVSVITIKRGRKKKTVDGDENNSLKKG